MAIRYANTPPVEPAPEEQPPPAPTPTPAPAPTPSVQPSAGAGDAEAAALPPDAAGGGEGAPVGSSDPIASPPSPPPPAVHPPAPEPDPLEIKPDHAGGEIPVVGNDPPPEETPALPEIQVVGVLGALDAARRITSDGLEDAVQKSEFWTKQSQDFEAFKADILGRVDAVHAQVQAEIQDIVQNTAEAAAHQAAIAAVGSIIHQDGDTVAIRFGNGAWFVVKDLPEQQDLGFGRIPAAEQQPLL